MSAKYLLVFVPLVFCIFRDAVAANTTVTVVWKQIPFGNIATFTVNNTIEYIVEVVPHGEQGLWPSHVSLSINGGNSERPVLITARHNAAFARGFARVDIVFMNVIESEWCASRKRLASVDMDFLQIARDLCQGMLIRAQTWQLPYEADGKLRYKLERTLCILDDVEKDSECDELAQDKSLPRGQFILHIASSCAANLDVYIAVTADTTWQLPFQRETTLFAREGAPVLRYYNFTESQDNVRLVFASTDEECATVSIQNYTCPTPQTLTEIGLSGVRMTMQRSGAVQISRKSFPNGFVVIVIVHYNDVECEGRHGSDENDVRGLKKSDEDAEVDHTPRQKDVKLIIKAGLSRGQYAVAAIVLTVVFLSFYVLFGFFVFLQRIPRWNQFVNPKAVLQGPVHETMDDLIDLGSSSTNRRQRRHSIRTLDSSDNSDTDDEDEAPPFSSRPRSPVVPGSDIMNSPVAPIRPTSINGGVVETQIDSVAEAPNTNSTAHNPPDAQSQSPRPFGLPSNLNLADLSKRKSRIHEARSDRYLNTLYTVAVFYALPVMQFVAAFQLILNTSGNLDLCYYNFLCAHPAGVVSDFNHVYSNLGYLLLGALFMFQVRRRRTRRKNQPKHDDYGIPPHYGLLSALGAGMMVVALLSASYHICPNQLNFQFDTAFMYVLAVLSMVKIYQSRHPDVNARAHATFGVLAILIALVVWGVLGGSTLFWAFFTVLHVITFLVLSLRIYYVGQFRLDKEGITEATRGFREVQRPLYTSRLVMLVIANAVNWLFAIYGLLTMSADFASHLLQVLLGNTLMYMIAYIVSKLLHGERLRWYSWLFLLGATLTWAPSLYFFTYGNSSWSATPAQSRHRNHECKILEFYDSHDLWHAFSAISLFLTFNVLLTWDDGLSAVKRTEITVF